MKYRDFRNIAAVVAFAALGGTCYGCYAWWQVGIARTEKDRQDHARVVAAERAQSEQVAREEARLAMVADQQRQLDVAADAAVRQKSPGSYWSSAHGLRPVDLDVLALLDRPVVDKIKDATRGKPWKVNIYSDDKVRFNRIKVDLDRDEKADESWTIKADGSVERNVAEADDEKYNRHWRLDRTSGWVSLDAPAQVAPTATATATPVAASGAGLRAVDADMMALVKGPAQEKVKDATKGKPWKINLYSDDGARFGRAKVDLNRNDKWDESWTFGAEGSVERKVAPGDDENYTEVFVLNNNTWQKK